MNQKLSGNKIKDILSKLNQEIKEHPERYINYYYKAKILFKIKNFSLAHKVLDRALELNSSAAEVYSLKANIFDCEKNYEKSIEYFNKALDIEENSEDYFNLAIVYYVQSNYSEALTNIQMALKFQPGSFEYWFYSGIILEELEKYELAFNVFINILNVCENSDEYYILERIRRNARNLLEELTYEKDKYIEEENYEKAYDTILKILDVLYEVNRCLYNPHVNRLLGKEFSITDIIKDLANILLKLEKYEYFFELYKNSEMVDERELLKINKTLYNIVQKISDNISVKRKFTIVLCAKDRDTIHDYYYSYKLGLLFESESMYDKAILSYIEVLQSTVCQLNPFFKKCNYFYEKLEYVQFSLKRIISILVYSNNIKNISHYLKNILSLINTIIEKLLGNKKVEYSVKYNKCIEFCDLAINIIEKITYSNRKVLEKMHKDFKNRNNDVLVLDNYLTSVWNDKKCEIMEEYTNAIIEYIEQEGGKYLENELNTAISIFEFLIKLNPNNAHYYYKKAKTIQFKLFLLNKYKFESEELSTEFFNQNKEEYLIALKLYDTAVKLNPEFTKYSYKLTNLINEIKELQDIDVDLFLERYNVNKEKRKFYRYVNFENYDDYIVYDDDIYGPDWLGGTETEDQYYEH